MASPALRIPVTADISQFQREMQRTTDIAGKATLAVTKQVITMNASWLASQGAAGAATLAFGRVLGVLGPIALGITAVRDAFKLMAYATELAKARIEEFNKVTEEANASGFSTEFFQRVVKSGGQARDKIVDLTEALKKFNAESTPKLGGSNLQQRLDTLSKAGNFAGNSGVGALAGSNNSERRLRATVQLIDEAMQKGERLAAIDLTETAFGPKVAAALRADSSYLDDMIKRADAISKAQLISDEDLGRAVELKRRMEDAQKVLADRWKPIQDDLAKLGTNYHENWVSITETLAEAVGLATSLYQALGKVPDWFAKRIGGASVWSDLTAATERLGLNSAPADLVTDPKVIAMDGARSKLNAALQNYANVTRSMRETSDVVTAVRGDSSKAPGKVVEAEANAFERAADGVEKYTSRLEADTKAVGLGAAALAEYRAEAALMVAAQQAGIPVTQALRDRIQDLAQDASDASDKLARAKVASEISFGRQAAFVSPEDAQIARQLAGIYGDDVPRALQSSEAAALRLNNALTDINRTGQDVTRGLFTDFTQQIRNGTSALDALKAAGINALGKISDKLVSMAADNLWSSAFGGSSGGVGGFFTSLFGGGGSAPGSIRVGNQSFPAFASGTNFAPGGLALVGERGPELVNLPRGAEVIPNHELPGAMGGAVTAPINISIDARGADREGLARVENQIASLKAELPSRVVTAVRDAKRTRAL